MKLLRKIIWLTACILCLTLSTSPVTLAGPDRMHQAPPSLQATFTAAAGEFAVPEAMLPAVAYNMSRWEHHAGAPSVAGGYGIMHLTALDQAIYSAARGDGIRRTTTADDPALQTLNAAAELLQLDPDLLKAQPAQNIRGGADLLAQYAREQKEAL